MRMSDVKLEAERLSGFDRAIEVLRLKLIKAEKDRISVRKMAAYVLKHDPEYRFRAVRTEWLIIVRIAEYKNRIAAMEHRRDSGHRAPEEMK